MYEKLQDGGNSFYSKYYLAHIFARWLRPNTKGLYWWDDVPGDSSTGAELVAGQTVSGQADYSGDRDWYRVSLEAGQAYNIDVLSVSPGLIWQPSAGATTYLSRPLHQAADLILEVRDGQGQMIASDDDSASLLAPHIQFVPTATGCYYVAIGGFTPHTGSYALGVNLPGLDPAASFDDQTGAGSAGAATLSVGRRVTGAVDYAGDVDWFKVSLTQWETYGFQMKDLASWQPVSSLDPLLSLYSSTGALLASDDDGGGWLDAKLTYLATISGEYYLNICGVGAGEGAWALNSWAVDVQAGDTSTAGTLAVGGSSYGAISRNGDQDWFKVSLGACSLYQLDLEGLATGQGTLVDPVLDLYDSAGALITRADDGGEGFNSHIEFTPTASGSYYLGAKGQGTGTYRLSASTPADIQPSDSSTSSTLTLGGTTTGIIGTTTDQDWFKVSLTAGQFYRFDMAGADTGQGTMSKPYLRLYNTSGTTAMYTDSVGTGIGYDARLFYSPSVSGIYFLAAQGVSGSSGSYRLGGQEISDDYPANSSTTATLTMGGSISGALQSPGEADWFQVSLNAGTVYQFDMTPGYCMYSYSSCQLEIKNAVGSQLAGQTYYGGPGNAARLFYTPSQSGVYYLVTSTSTSQTSMVPYTVSASTVGVDDYLGNTQTAGTLTLGAQVTGTAQSWGDEDWFAVSLQTDTFYRFDLKGYDSGKGTLERCWIKVLSSTGSLFTNNVAGGTGYDAFTLFQTSATGIYYISAQGSNDMGTYTLSGGQVSDDYSNVSTSAATLAVGSAAFGLRESSDDQDWFKVTLTSGRSYEFRLSDNYWHPGWYWSLGSKTLTLVSGGGATLGSDAKVWSTDGHADAVFNYSVAASGWYYLQVDGPSGARGGYVLSAWEGSAPTTSSPDDYAGDSTTTGTLGLGGYVTGFIGSASDEDWFKISVTPGQLYEFSVEGLDTGQGTLGANNFSVAQAYGDWLPTGSSTGESSSGVGMNTLIDYCSPTYSNLYLKVRGVGDTMSTGSYRLSATAIADDFAGTSTSTGTLAMGGSRTGALQAYNDQDWFRVTLTAGTCYQFTVDGLLAKDGIGAPVRVYLRDSVGNTLVGDGFASGDGGAAQVNYMPSASGTYWVGVQGNRIGSYRVSAGTLADDFSASTASGFGTLAVGSSRTGVIQANTDQDWFRISLSAGTKYVFDVMGAASGQGTAIDSRVILYDSTGSQITYDSNAGLGNNAALVYTPSASGYYFLSASAFVQPTGTYTINAIVDDYDSDLSATGGFPIATTGVFSSTTGNIERDSDRDWFKATLNGGCDYLFRLQGQDSGQGTLADPTLYIQDSNGVMVSSADSGLIGRDAELGFTPVLDCVIYLSVGSNGDRGTGSYTLSAAMGHDDYLSGTSTTASLAVGNSVPGHLELTGDQDWFPVSLESGLDYQFDLEGANTTQGTLIDPHLHLYRPDATQLDSADDGGVGTNSRIAYHATASGIYYLGAGGASDLLTGTYLLRATQLVDEVGSSTSTAASISLGEPLTGGIQMPDDLDWFQVSLDVGTAYYFSLEGESSALGPLGLPLLNLYDENGQLLIQGSQASEYSTSGVNLFASEPPGSSLVSSNNGNDLTAEVEEQVNPAKAFIFFQPSTSGAFFLEAASSASSTVSNNGNYWLEGSSSNPINGTYSLAAYTDDYLDTTDTTGAVTVGGVPVSGEINWDKDVDFFKVSLQRGKYYQFDLKRNYLTPDGLSDPYLKLYSTSGDILRKVGEDNDDGIENNACLIYKSNSDGVYFLSAEANNCSATRYYTLEAIKLATDPIPAIIGNCNGAQDIWVARSWTGGPPDPEDWPNQKWDVDGVSYGDKTITLTASDTENYSAEINSSTKDYGYGTYTLTIGSDLLKLDRRLVFGFFTYDSADSSQNEREIDIECSYSQPGVNPNATNYTDGNFIQFTNHCANMHEHNESLPASTYTYYTRESTSINDSLKGAKLQFTWLPTSLSYAVIGSNGQLISSWEYSDYISHIPKPTPDNNTAVCVNLWWNGTYPYECLPVEARSVIVTGFEYETPVSDDYTGNTSTKGSVSVAPVSGSMKPAYGGIDYLCDRDWFKVSLTAKQEYVIDVEGSSIYGGTLIDPKVFVYSSNGGPALTSSDGEGVGSNARLTFAPTVAGNYFIGVGESGDDACGTYRVRVTADQSANTSTIGVVGVGGSGTGGDIQTIGDHDWFKVLLSGGKKYTFSLSGADSGNETLTDPYLNLYNTAGNVILASSNDANGTRDSSMSYDIQTSGYYYLDTSGNNNYTGTYRLKVVEIAPPDDYGDDLDDSEQVPMILPGSYRSGVIGTSSDVDVFCLAEGTGRASQWPGQGMPADYSGNAYYTVTVKGTTSGGMALAMPMVWLGAFEIPWENWDNVGYRSITGTGADGYSATINTGRYDWDDSVFIRVAGYSGATGNYTVSVSGVKYRTNDAVSLSVPTNSTRVYKYDSLSYADNNPVDCYKVSMSSGCTYNFLLQGAASNNGTLRRPFLYLFDQSRNIVAYSATGSADSDALLQYSCTQNGYYTLLAKGSISPTGGATGTYRLVAWDPPTECVTPSVIDATLTIPTDSTHVSSSGTLDASAALDWFQVSLSSGCEYHFDLMGSGDAPLADPYLYIYNSAGTLLRQDDNSGANVKDAHLDFKCGVGLDGEAGAYYIGVASADGVSTGSYTLEAWDPPIAGYGESSGLSTTMAATLSQVEATGSRLAESVLTAVANSATASQSTATTLAPDAGPATGGGSGSDTSSSDSAAPASPTATTTAGTTGSGGQTSTAATTASAGSNSTTTASTLMAAANTQVAAPTLTAPASTGSATTLVAPH